MPMPVDDEYRKQVQGKVQDLLSGRREKPTLKLVVEAVVEGVRLYRSYKKERAAEEKKERRGKGNPMNRVVDADIVVIVPDQAMKSVEDIIVVREMAGIQHRETDAEMSLVGSASKGPGLGTDAQDFLNDMERMMFSRTHRMTIWIIR
ncbi:hypothetical protein G6011_07793 [Alternaria panax]|uniref:Uncharacterized protein n=1 Tax=Alternaria panax TaxID=48097 RepID=A0AAD4I778_9PLEO|nr:hypothetical protein G6011_07793 [Alternaria panax]